MYFVCIQYILPPNKITFDFACISLIEHVCNMQDNILPDDISIYIMVKLIHTIRNITKREHG